MFRDNTPPVFHVAMYPPSHSVHTQSHLPSQPLSPFSHSVHSAIQSTHIAPTHSTAKRRIHREKASPRHSLKPPQGPHRPLLISQGRPLLGDPVPHRPVIPRRQEHPPPGRPSPIAMDPIHPLQHGRLVLRQSAIPKPPGMKPQLLPVKVTHLQHAKPREQRVSMAPPPSPSNQPSKPFLVTEQGTAQRAIPGPLEVPSDHQAVLQMGQD